MEFNCFHHQDYQITKFCIDDQCYKNHKFLCQQCELEQEHHFNHSNIDINQLPQIIIESFKEQSILNQHFLTNNIQKIKNELSQFINNCKLNFESTLCKLEHHIMRNIMYQHKKIFSKIRQQLQQKYLEINSQQFNLHTIYYNEQLTEKLHDFILFQKNREANIDQMNLTHLIQNMIEKFTKIQHPLDQLITQYKQLIINESIQQFSIYSFENDPIKCYKSHNEQINALLVINEQEFLTGGNSGQIYKWNIKQKEDRPLVTLIGHKDKILTLELINQQDKVIFASGSADNTIKIWDIINQNCIITLLGHQKYVTIVKCIDQDHIISGGSDNSIKIWNLQTQQQTINIENAHKDIIRDVLLIKNIMISASSDKTLKIWEKSNLQQIKTIQLEDKQYCLALINEQQFASGSGITGKIRIFNIINFDCELQLEAHQSSVYKIILLNKNYIASSSYDYTAKIWDLKTKQCMIVLEAHSDSVNSIAMLNSQNLITISDDKYIIIWN